MEKKELSIPNKNLLVTLISNYKRLEAFKSELYDNAKALWESLPNGVKISCCDEGMEIHNDEYNGLITNFTKNVVGDCFAEVVDDVTNESSFILVTELPTDYYLYLANFIAEKYKNLIYGE